MTSNKSYILLVT